MVQSGHSRKDALVSEATLLKLRCGQKQDQMAKAATEHVVVQGAARHPTPQRAEEG